MPKAKEAIEIEAIEAPEEEAPKAKKGDREARFDAHVENYLKANPVKGAAKKARGEFDKIPDSFK